MNVTLVVPNFRWVDSDKNAQWHYLPYNLCLLAACIQDKHRVSILDAYKLNLSQMEFAQHLSKLKPDLVGITVLMDKYGPSGHLAAKIAKSIGAKVVMGGVYASMNTKQAAQDTNIDHIITGEGELTFDYLVNNLGQANRILVGTRIDNLNALPYPAYELIDYNSYANTASRNSVDRPPLMPYARIITSRGCPFNCVFCQVHSIAGKEFRPRSVGSILDEIEWLKDRYNIQSICFDDDNMLNDRERARQLFKGMMERGLEMPWVMIATAAFKLDEELIRYMKGSGCTYVNIAIESGTERVLHKIIKKPVNLADAMLVVKMLQEYGIYVAANFIVGFPTETWDEIRATLAYADHLNADYTKIFAAIPLKNTRLWELCEQEGAFRPGFTGTAQWNQGQIQTKDFTARDLTILRAYEWDRINFSNPAKRARTAKQMGITEQELLDIRRNTLNNV